MADGRLSLARRALWGLMRWGYAICERRAHMVLQACGTCIFFRWAREYLYFCYCFCDPLFAVILGPGRESLLPASTFTKKAVHQSRHTAAPHTWTHVPRSFVFDADPGADARCSLTSNVAVTPCNFEHAPHTGLWLCLASAQIDTHAARQPRASCPLGSRAPA